MLVRDLPAVEDLVTETKIHRSVYTDPDVFSVELERIWYKTWLLAGHECEIPNPGDFKTTFLGKRPVIICRDETGRVRAFLNSCRHRGALLCRAKSGRKKLFQCLYHAWSYNLDGTLAGVPSADGYGDDFRKAEFSLWELPRVDTYRGVIFASFSDAVPALDEHLGASRPFIDLAFGTGASAELVGLQEYTYRGNWKLHWENTVDGYHPKYLHRFVAPQWVEGRAVDLGHGQGLLEWKKPPEHTVNDTKTNRTLVIFPNMALVCINEYVNLRMIIPISHDRTRMFAMALGVRGEDAETRDRRAKQLSGSQGPAGIAGADDIELFESAQEGFATGVEQIAWLDMSRGAARGSTGALEDENAIRGCYREWRRLMAAGTSA